ncbi:eCIS core domain-containing protein [Algoriphagus jejuensis]|uniref:eCIS core domain-containing protein n=1 Tax=Algoriphagus jejuensis TaxID=419934 RepID=UPI0031D8F4F7
MSNLDGKGRVLSNVEKRFFEPRFGRDFSKVRVHENDCSADEINAKAYATRNHIVFNQGEYSGNSTRDKKLMAHELTHVVQQREGVNPKIQRAIGDGHDLSSPRFAGDAELEEVYDGNKVLEAGERGGHVNKIQHAIQDKGFFLINHGIDGIFEDETRRGVRTYQQNKGVTADPIGKVGTNTMAALDSDFPTVVDNASTLSQNPADVVCLQEILCPWNASIINDFRSGSRVVILVDDLFWADEIFQGGSWQAHPMQGAGETSGNTIRLNISDDCETVARPLYHEYQHARSPRRLRTQPWADEEDYAYTLETNWSIGRGLSPDPGLVTTDPVSGETVIDQTSLDAHVATYPGMGANEEVIAKVGSNRVRVRRENGSVYVRNAANGDTVPGPRQILNPRTVRPLDWPTCP